MVIDLGELEHHVGRLINKLERKDRRALEMMI